MFATLRPSISTVAQAAFTCTPAFRSAASTLRRGNCAWSREKRDEELKQNYLFLSYVLSYVFFFVPLYYFLLLEHAEKIWLAPRLCGLGQRREYPSKKPGQKRQCPGWRMTHGPKQYLHDEQKLKKLYNFAIRSTMKNTLSHCSSAHRGLRA